MIHNFDDPKVKEWMREHPEETAVVQQKYDELSKLSLSELFEMAPDEVRAKVKDRLVAAIIAKGS